MAEERAQRRLAAILAADVVGYSRLMEADEAGHWLRSRPAAGDPPAAGFQASRPDLQGDGRRRAGGVRQRGQRCRMRVELQEAMAAANAGLPEDRRIVLRIGINLGDVMVEGSDLYGDGVNIAARLEALAEPGGILVSQTASAMSGKVKLGFEDLGEQKLKNIAEPVRVYRLSGRTRCCDHRAAVPKALSRQALDRRPAIRQHERRSRAGVFLRRHGGGDHHGPVALSLAVRHRAQSASPTRARPWT